MQRTLLILDGTNQLRDALTEASHLCDPGDKLTVLAVAEKPSPALLGTERSPMTAEPYTGGGLGTVASSGASDVPVFEADDATERRVAGELRDQLDEQVATFDSGDIELWTQAIVRDEPAEAVAAYVRSSDVERIAVPRASLPRLRELLGVSAMDGGLAPVILLPSR
jgi:hypothetical protein